MYLDVNAVFLDSAKISNLMNEARESGQRFESGNIAQSLSVIIPHYGSADFFLECLGALRKSELVPLEIIAVIDGDSDLVKPAEEIGVRVIFNSSPVGDARARNQGAQIAQGNILVFLDSDVLVRSDSLALIKKHFMEDKSLGAVFGFFQPNTPAQGFFPNYKNLLLHYTHITSSSKASTFSSACGAVRTDVFRSVGGFPERHGKQTLCDVELGYLIHEAGFSISLAKDLQVTHLKQWTFRSLLKTDINLRAIPWTRMILERRKRFVNTLNLTLSNRLSVIFSYLSVIFLFGAVLHPFSLCLASALWFIVLMLNLSLWKFFFQMRGLNFTLKAMLWHTFFFLYSGYGFVVALVQHINSRTVGKSSSQIGHV